MLCQSFSPERHGHLPLLHGRRRYRHGEHRRFLFASHTGLTLWRTRSRDRAAEANGGVCSRSRIEGFARLSRILGQNRPGSLGLHLSRAGRILGDLVDLSGGLVLACLLGLLHGLQCLLHVRNLLRALTDVLRSLCVLIAVLIALLIDLLIHIGARGTAGSRVAKVRLGVRVKGKAVGQLC